MKNTDIKKLLDRYDHGELSVEELQRLYSETHRDDVLESAMGMASEFRKKRWKTVSYVATVLVLVCGVGLLMWPMWMEQEEVKFAQVDVKPIPVATATVDVPVIEEETIEIKKDKVKIKKVEQREIIVNEEHLKSVIEKVSSNEIIVAPLENEVNEAEIIQDDVEPQVLCNVQCDADSVINEVWNFLKV